MLCSLCPRKCQAQRTDNENLKGFCKMPLLPRVARAALHFWEEPCISGQNGSGTIFFSGCSLSCVFCQNYDISHNGYGKDISIERLAEIFRELEQKGAHNINLVSPTHYALAIKKALDIYKPNIPIVYNSNGYESKETLKLLQGYIDIFLLDFKYFDNEKALRFSGANDYTQVAKETIIEAYRQQPNCVFEGGIMKKGVIIRHLLMPQATNDAINIFEWVKNNTPSAYFSLMSQYIPYGEAVNIKPINRKITKREYEKVLNYILESGFQNIYFQELKSADEKFIPQFDLSGV